MPTQLQRVTVTLYPEELNRLRKEASGDSDSNLIRRKLKLPPLKQGARKGNKNAKKH